MISYCIILVGMGLTSMSGTTTNDDSEDIQSQLWILCLPPPPAHAYHNEAEVLQLIY